jgi:CheY-like chemotaxis protein
MNKHILIVDDEVEIRSLLAEYFMQHGFRVTAVATAVEAVQIVQRDAPDLIISDLQLEDSDGLEMIGRLKTLRPDIPVILLTGVLFDPKVVAETLSSKVSCYLPKTSPMTQIMAEIRRLIRA